MTVQVSNRDNGPEWSIARVFYPAGEYHHPPAGIVQLRLVCSGSSYALIDLGSGPRRVFTRPGDLLLSLPDRATTFHIDDGRELLLLEVGVPLIRRIALEAGGSAPDDLLPLLIRPFREPFIAALCRRLEAASPGQPSVQGWILGLIFSALLDASNVRHSTTRKVILTPESVSALSQRIESKLESPHSVESLAKFAGMPRRLFAAAFREATGLPVHQFVLRRRVDRAAELLRSSDVPLAEIAVNAGFAHQAHMSRVLKKMLGKTPGVIRNTRD